MHCGFVTVRAMGIDGIRRIKRIKIRMTGDKVYVSAESDSLDRDLVSATAIAKMETRTKRELLALIAMKTPRSSVQILSDFLQAQSTPTQSRRRCKAAIRRC